MNTPDAGQDMARHAYTQARIDHWNQVAAVVLRRPGLSQNYRRRLRQVCQFLVPAGKRVLELGCGRGELLTALAPQQGIGVDFSPAMLDQARRQHPHCVFIERDVHELSSSLQPELREPPDVILLSDLVNDLWDVREALSGIRHLCSPDTRIICNFHSHLWEAPAQWAQQFGAMTPRLEQNWLTTDDLANLLHLAGFEVVRSFDDFLWPWATLLVEPLCNRWLAKLLPFRWLTLTHFIICRLEPERRHDCVVSVVIPARNEAGNIEAAVQRVPEMGAGTELIFVEGGSTDTTWAAVQEAVSQHPERKIKALQQTGKGKGDAVRLGFSQAEGEILMILDADLTVPPESLPQFYEALISGKAEFVNGVRLVYPQEKEAMRFFNLLGNKFFSWAFSWLLDRSVKDTLCGTKVLSRNHYRQLAANRGCFGEFDPFGDFDLLFGAAKMNLRIVDLPVRYRERTYGDTNIQRWRHGAILLRMVLFAASRLKFI
ncbi:MAG: glycosyltransferase [Candidatus Electronema sp. V4]|uniref:glycosyltransferase n=1 Tax=Candidatus Electronema sp. V4 TaxID=3454756 RepID=UPI0040554CBE